MSKRWVCLEREGSGVAACGGPLRQDRHTVALGRVTCKPCQGSDYYLDQVGLGVQGGALIITREDAARTAAAPAAEAAAGAAFVQLWLFGEEGST